VDVTVPANDGWLLRGRALVATTDLLKELTVMRELQEHVVIEVRNDGATGALPPIQTFSL
jgi:hypothetical protein